MELRYLQTFKTIVEAGSFTTAAQRLNYTQSTITFQIGQLERELSAKLFEKIGRNMVLTKAGEQLIPYVDEVLQSISKLHFFESDLSECQGDLHIGSGETLLCYLLPSVLKKFHQHAPKARLFLRSMNCYEIRNELLDGKLDLGIFYKDVEGFGSNLTLHTIKPYTVSLIVSPNIARKYNDFITDDQEIPLPFIIDEPDCIFRQMFEQYLRQKSIRLDRVIELWSIPTIKNLVMNDIGISFLPTFTVESELIDGRLKELPTDMSNSTITAVCAHHKNKWISPLMKLFIELCTTKLQ